MPDKDPIKKNDSPAPEVREEQEEQETAEELPVSSTATKQAALNEATENSAQNNEAATKQGSLKSTFITLFLIVILIAVVSIFTFLALKLIDIPWNKIRLPNSTSSTEETASIVSPSPANDSVKATEGVSKGQLTVEVLNGSGVAKQASKIKVILTNIGFTDIETGNAPTSDNIKTRVAFTSKVTKDIRLEVTKELEKVFSSVEASDQTESDTKDIVVITGQYSSNQ